MNLMFRKNFQPGSGGGGKSGATKLNKMNRTGKRSRDMSCSGPSADDCHYRTHIFFNANRGAYQDNCEG